MIFKKAQIGSTITWMVAFVIIFFVMMLFLLGVGTLAIGGKAFGADVKYDVARDVPSLSGQRDILKLLNSEVEFGGESVEFISAFLEIDESSSDEDKKRFFEIAELFFSDNYNMYFLESDLIEREFMCGKNKASNFASYDFMVSRHVKHEFKFYRNNEVVELNIYVGDVYRQCL